MSETTITEFNNFLSSVGIGEEGVQDLVRAKYGNNLRTMSEVMEVCSKWANQDAIKAGILKNIEIPAV